MAEGTKEISKDDGGGGEKEKKRRLSQACDGTGVVLNRQPKLYIWVYDLLCQQKRPLKLDIQVWKSEEPEPEFWIEYGRPLNQHGHCLLSVVSFSIFSWQYCPTSTSTRCFCVFTQKQRCVMCQHGLAVLAATGQTICDALPRPSWIPAKCNSPTPGRLGLLCR